MIESETQETLAFLKSQLKEYTENNERLQSDILALKKTAGYPSSSQKLIEELSILNKSAQIYTEKISEKSGKVEETNRLLKIEQKLLHDINVKYNELKDKARCEEGLREGEGLDRGRVFQVKGFEREINRRFLFEGKLSLDKERLQRATDKALDEYARYQEVWARLVHFSLEKQRKARILEELESELKYLDREIKDELKIFKAGKKKKLEKTQENSVCDVSVFKSSAFQEHSYFTDKVSNISLDISIAQHKIAEQEFKTKLLKTSMPNLKPKLSVNYLFFTFFLSLCLLLGYNLP